MHAKYNTLTAYENNFLEEDSINFVIKSKNIVSKKIKRKLLFEWNKTKWFLKNNEAVLTAVENLDHPAILEIILVYSIQKKLWPKDIKFPWAYFAALALGLKPESEMTWVLISPANIGLNLYQANLKIITADLLDKEREEILKRSILKFGGQVICCSDQQNFYLARLPKKFDVMEGIFPNKNSQLSSLQFGNSNEVNSLWRTLITEVEMEWHKLSPNKFNINTLWTWGWGSMPSSLESSQSRKPTEKNNLLITDAANKLIINGLVIWLENKTQNKFSLNTTEKKNQNIDLTILHQFSDTDQNNELFTKIEATIKDFIDELSAFNATFEKKNNTENIFIFNDNFILYKKNDSKISVVAKFILHLKSLLISI